MSTVNQIGFSCMFAGHLCRQHSAFGQKTPPSNLWAKFGYNMSVNLEYTHVQIRRVVHTHKRIDVCVFCTTDDPLSFLSTSVSFRTGQMMGEEFRLKSIWFLDWAWVEKIDPWATLNRIPTDQQEILHT